VRAHVRALVPVGTVMLVPTAPVSAVSVDTSAEVHPATADSRTVASALVHDARAALVGAG
jgi:hypothetical protein